MSECVCYVRDKCFLVGCLSPWEQKMSWCRLLSNPSLFFSKWFFKFYRDFWKFVEKNIYILMLCLIPSMFVIPYFFSVHGFLIDPFWLRYLQPCFLFFFFFLHVLWLALSKCQCLGDLQCFLIFFLLCFLLLLCSPPTMTKKCLTLCSALAVSIAKICGSTGTECCYLFFLFFLWLISHGWEILWEH